MSMLNGKSDQIDDDHPTTSNSTIVATFDANLIANYLRQSESPNGLFSIDFGLPSNWRITKHNENRRNDTG